MSGEEDPMARFWSWLLAPGAGSTPPVTLLVRLVVGWVFFTSGLVKLMHVNQGAARFARLGIPAPEFTAAFVSTIEMAAGILVMLGFVTRLAAIPLIIIMLVALISSKLPLMVGPGPEPVNAPPQIGFWAFAYQARLDVAMLLLAVFLLAVGAGAWSLDAWLAERRATSGGRAAPAPQGM